MSRVLGYVGIERSACRFIDGHDRDEVVRSNGVTSPTSSDYRTLPLRACLAVYAIMGWCIQKVTGGAQPGFSALADTPPD